MQLFFIALAALAVFNIGCIVPQVSAAPVASDEGDENCTTADLSGLVEIGCWGYKKCVDGNLTVVMCPAGQVLERDSMTCVDHGTGNTDCDEKFSCEGKEDKLYADLGDKCQTYVRCLNQVVLGPWYCPGRLVFNEKAQTCDYPANVIPPCGSKSVIG